MHEDDSVSTDYWVCGTLITGLARKLVEGIKEGVCVCMFEQACHQQETILMLSSKMTCGSSRSTFPQNVLGFQL